jgi:hypothetical protein
MPLLSVGLIHWKMLVDRYFTRRSYNKLSNDQAYQKASVINEALLFFHRFDFRLKHILLDKIDDQFCCGNPQFFITCLKPGDTTLYTMIKGCITKRRRRCADNRCYSCSPFRIYRNMLLYMIIYCYLTESQGKLEVI